MVRLLTVRHGRGLSERHPGTHETAGMHGENVLECEEEEATTASFATTEETARAVKGDVDKVPPADYIGYITPRTYPGALANTPAGFLE